ncbi:MAG: SPASM domain-containing protein [Bacteroidia bacterium]
MAISNTLNLLSKLSLRRSLNGMRVVAGYFWSKWTKKPHQWGLPVSVSIEPTTACNLRCPECPSGLRNFTRPTGMLEESLFRKTIDELAPHLTWLTFYFQGEPYLHPKFTDLVKYASQKKIYTTTSTNAHYLDDEQARKTVESGLDRLIISIDGTTQETYSAYRVGGKLEKVLDGTRQIVRWKKELRSRTPHLVFQFLVVRPNEHQIADVKKLANELGVDEVVFKTAQVYDYENGNALIPQNTQYARYTQDDSGRWKIKNPLANHCWKMWHSCVITWDGAVVPCCFDKDAQHKLGNMQTTSMRNLWFGKDYQHFRASILRSRSEIEMCKNCSEGSLVWSS